MIKIIKKFFKLVYKVIFTGLIAAMFGWAKSYGYKTDLPGNERDNSKIEGKK